MTQAAKRGGALGGGGAMLGLAKLWFLVASYATSIALTHLLDPDVFGQYYVVARLIAVPNMVLIYTVLFSVSRPLAAQFEQGFPAYGGLRRRGVRLALALGGATSVIFFVAAPTLAAGLHDPSLITPIRVVAPISLLYAVYAVNLGTLNAIRRFGHQATMDIFMASAKAGLIIAAAALGLGLSATVGGFTAASAAALMLSAVLVARVRPPGAGRTAAAPMVGFAGLLVVFTAVVNLLQSADVLLLKSFAEGQAQQDAVGFYSTAQQVALVPYSLMNAIALLVFPLVAALDPVRDRNRLQTYVAETAKVTLLLLCFMSAVGSASASDIQALLFPRAYGAAADELRLLVWGFSGYSFAVTVAWVFNSGRRSLAALGLVAVPLCAVVIGAFTLVPEHHTTGAAIAVAVAGGAAAVVASIALYRSFRAHVPAVHLAKIALAVVAVEAVAWVWPAMSTAGLVGKLLILVKLVVLSGTFVAVVAATRAVTLEQIRELRRAR